MNNINQRIIEVIDAHHVLTVTVARGHSLWPFHCFYVWLRHENLFIFTSDPQTRHGQIMEDNPHAAAGIVLETKTIGKIQGIQMTGTIKKCDGELLVKAKKEYLKAYPYARLHLETLWAFEPDIFKLTDNRLGFGKKLLWEKEKS